MTLLRMAQVLHKSQSLSLGNLNMLMQCSLEEAWRLYRCTYTDRLGEATVQVSHCRDEWL